MAKNDNDSKFNFEKDERVLCYHGPFIYEAKILKREQKEETEDNEAVQYFVHYKGWKQTWDEWISEARVLKYTDENLQKQKQLKQMNSKRKPSRTSSSTAVTSSLNDSSSVTESRSRKRHRDSSIDKARLEEETKRPEFRLSIPDTLKSLLVDDWENVTKNRQTMAIPRDITVDKILENYKEQCPVKDEALDEFIQGIRLYFNKMLGASLLYRTERKQYEDYFVDLEKDSSNVYGAEHLLRLFVEIPNLVSQTNMDMETLNELRERFEDILKFIQNHEKEYFTNDYNQISG